MSMHFILFIIVGYFITFICLTPVLKKHLDSLVLINPFFRSEKIWGTITETQEDNTIGKNLITLMREPISVVTYNYYGDVKKACLLRCKDDAIGRKVLLAVNQHKNNIVIRVNKERCVINHSFHTIMSGIYYIVISFQFFLRSIVKGQCYAYVLCFLLILLIYYFTLPIVLQYLERHCMQNYEYIKNNIDKINFPLQIDPHQDLFANKITSYVTIITLLVCIGIIITIFVILNT